MICFDEQSVIVNEDQGSIMFTLTITNNSSIDTVLFTVTVIATNGTAVGK